MPGFTESNIILKFPDNNFFRFSNCRGYLPCTPANATVMKFITVVHCDTHQRADVQLMNDSFKNKFKPYAELFGIRYYSVVNHQSAKVIVPNNMIQ